MNTPKTIDSKEWEPTDRKKNSQEEPLLLKAPTVAIEIQSTGLRRKLVLKSAKMGKTIPLGYVHLPSHLKLDTSVGKRDI